MNEELIKLESRTTADGCLAIWTLPVVKAAVNAAAPRDGQLASSRGKMPRFMVKVDGQKLTCERKDKLAEILSTIQAGATCRVFRNAGWGATIDFDKGAA